MTFANRLRTALPSLRFGFAGSLAWGVSAAAIASISLVLRGWTVIPDIAATAGLFLLGGAIAFAPAAMATRLLGGKRFETAFAAAMLGLAALTLGVAAALNGLAYREYYSNWHADFATKLWLIEFVFTFAAGVYQFLVLGVRLFLPIGLPALVFAAWLTARDAGKNA